jgi:flagellar basal body-associated protein FliL
MADKNVKSTEVAVEDLDDETAGKSAAALAGPREKGTRIVTIIGLLVMILTPMASYFVVKLSLPKAASQKRSEPAPVHTVTAVFNMDMLMVNIAETKGTRVLRMIPHLLLSEEGLVEQLAPMKARLMDKVASVASCRTIDELDGAKGRELMKEDIKVGINTLIEGKMNGAVVDVYFSEYLIQ